MSGSAEARDAILRSVRESLHASDPHDGIYAELHRREARYAECARAVQSSSRNHRLPAEWMPGVSAVLSAQFEARLNAVGGSSVVVSTADEARDAIFKILDDAGVHRAALSDSALLASLADHYQGSSSCEFLAAATRSEIFEVDAGISSAQWAIAESGTLVLESEKERNRLVSLVPPVHIVALPHTQLRATLGEVLMEIHDHDTALASRAITFITGPSRTADIEQTLVTGVHGPQRLFVVLVRDFSPDP